jgi:hypothetical protein
MLALEYIWISNVIYHHEVESSFELVEPIFRSFDLDHASITLVDARIREVWESCRCWDQRIYPSYPHQSRLLGQ